MVLEKGHGAGKKGMALEKRAWCGAMLKLARESQHGPAHMEPGCTAHMGPI